MAVSGPIHLIAAVPGSATIRCTALYLVDIEVDPEVCWSVMAPYISGSEGCQVSDPTNLILRDN